MQKTLTVGLTLLLFGCAAPVVPPSATAAPDLGKRLVADDAVVTSAHPQASQAGIDVLRQGGNAVDAAVATAFAVSVGEPQMSGLGGGGGMLIWLQDAQQAEYVDFYAAQPVEAFRNRAEEEGRSDLRVVAVPGEVAGLIAAHERFGRLPLATVMRPAIRMAEEGVVVNQILAQMIVQDSAKLAGYPESARVFLPEGRPLQPGELLRQPALAESLGRIAAQGSRGFYEGETARAVVTAMNEGGHPVTGAQFAGYTPRWKRPLCGEYRGRVVLSAPPPQTGSQIIQTLELLEPYELGSLGLPTTSGRAFDVLASALRVGMADSDVVDDPNWADVPADAVISEEYARVRGALVGEGQATGEVQGGEPAAVDNLSATPACAPLEPYRAGPPISRVPASGSGAVQVETAGETTHLSVVDEDGNAVALTQTNSSLFGSGARTAGFFLNNSGFRFDPEDLQVQGRSDWRVRRSTIAPTIVLEDGRVAMVVGAPGGGRIPTAIVQNMVYVLDYGLDPMEALHMPRIFPSADAPRVQLENGFPAAVLRQVRAMGYEPGALSFGYARLYMIARQGEDWIGVADPRHDGEVRGY